MLIQFKIIQFVIICVAALKVVYKKVSLGESRVRWQNKDISFIIFEICSIFLCTGDIWLEKHGV